MKISMKNDLCGVLNNGPLMVSVGGWVNETSGVFPFHYLKKNTTVVEDRAEKYKNLLEENSNNNIINNNRQYESSEAASSDVIDLFILPDHVTSYIVQSAFKKKKL